MAGTGGKRDGAGRKKGQLNKSTKEVKALAQKHGATAIRTLAKLMVSADSDAAKIAACKELLDRAYGKSTQPIAGDPDNPFVVQHIERIVRHAQN